MNKGACPHRRTMPVTREQVSYRQLTVVDSGSRATAQTQVTVLNEHLNCSCSQPKSESSSVTLQFTMVESPTRPPMTLAVVARITDTFADFATESIWTVDGVGFNPTIPMTFDQLERKSSVRSMMETADKMKEQPRSRSRPQHHNSKPSVFKTVLKGKR